MPVGKVTLEKINKIHSDLILEAIDREELLEKEKKGFFLFFFFFFLFFFFFFFYLHKMLAYKGHRFRLNSYV